jgi:hypothetical protein
MTFFGRILSWLGGPPALCPELQEDRERRFIPFIPSGRIHEMTLRRRAELALVTRDYGGYQESAMLTEEGYAVARELRGLPAKVAA